MLTINRIAGLIFLVFLFSCNAAPHVKTEVVEAQQESVEAKEDTLKTIKDTVTQAAVTDYLNRARIFEKMPDGTAEEQISKYEAFATLYIEYFSLSAKKDQYTPQEQQDNDQAFSIISESHLVLKDKLIRSMPNLTKDQEKRLDIADAKMNAFPPNVYVNKL